jgi:hypothetical protein
MSPVRYELGFYIPEKVILHSHRRDNLKSVIFLYFVFILIILLRMYTLHVSDQLAILKCTEGSTLFS